MEQLMQYIYVLFAALLIMVGIMFAANLKKKVDENISSIKEIDQKYKNKGSSTNFVLIANHPPSTGKSMKNA